MLQVRRRFLPAVSVIFDIACIIDLFVDSQYLIHMSNLLLTNYYFSIIGVVFATG